MHARWLLAIQSWFVLFVLTQFAMADAPRLALQSGDRVIIVGNTLAERMQYFNHWEALLHSRFPQLKLYVRNLGWSADEITLRPRSKDFQDHGHTLAQHDPSVLIAMFGFNESFAGPAGLARFEADLEKFLAAPQMIDQYSTARGDWDRSGAKLAELKPLPKLRQIVLVSPIAHENLHAPQLPDGEANNRNLALYTEAMRRVAAKHGTLFVDLFTPSRQLMQSALDKPLTINGVHLNEHGDRLIGAALDEALFGSLPKSTVALDAIHRAVQEKNLQFFYDHRAVNGFYIYGGRKNPFGTVNFPVEFKKLRAMIALRDQRIWDVAAGRTVSTTIDDSSTGSFLDIPSNAKNPIVITSPEESRRQMKLADGYEVNLFASEVEFPDLQNPVQFAFDARGRLWVCTMPTYPQYLPGTPVNDKILILEDVDGDGRADKQTVFADGLHLPTGFELGDGGAYVAQQPNLVFLRDTNGDDKADERHIVLHGFDSADSHHSISAFTWDQGGALYFEEGTFHHSQIETPYGPQRLVNAGVFRFEPRTARLSVFVSYGFANPWGHIVDGWGQNFVADASGGANYFGAAFSGDVDYPHKHASLKQFLVKQWRPTAGCELVSSRNFPSEAQGNYLLNNCIGFQGVLQYKMRDEGSGFAADPVDPLLQSSDPNFRPVDIEFAPDGTLYLCDWFNPLVGHMQHNLRDPNRDHQHGRIWRVRYTRNPVVKPSKLVGASVAELLAVLQNVPEERTRQRARIELRSRPTAEVLAAADAWLARIDSNDPQLEHHRLEALWQRQQHDVVDESFLHSVLRSPEPRARAAAVRVACYWRDRLSDPIALLRTLVADAHPRVRLEAIRALSFFQDEAALQATVDVLRQPLDDYLTYTLRETLATLNRRVRARYPDLKSDDPSPTARPLIALLEQSGVPESQVAMAVELVCLYGSASDLSYVLDNTLQSNQYAPAVRTQVIESLIDAATTRKVRPSGTLTSLEKLLASEQATKDAKFRQAVIRLSTIWKVANVAKGLGEILENPRSDVDAIQGAIDGLVALGDKNSLELLREMTTREAPSMRVRLRAVAALVKVDPKNAPSVAAGALSEAAPRDDVGLVMQAFLNQKGGAERLAEALPRRPLNAETAKVCLRYMYGVGRSDPALSDLLSKAALISADMKPPTPAEVQQIVADVAARGDAQRGEQVFRRADLSCFKCHALNKAGGNVGPELTTIGSISPADYIAHSILDPNLAIKEQYVTRIVATSNGEVFTGVVIDRNETRLNLRDAAGKAITIPIADIDEEAEGKSLMPQGLTKFLTRDELIDLVKFISELGRPGAYSLRSTPAIQRWRVLKPVPAALQSSTLSPSDFEQLVLRAKPGQWTTVYGQVNGELPLAELNPTESEGALLLQGEIQVTQPGSIVLDIQAPAETSVWLERQSLANEKSVTVDLPVGRHRLTLRVMQDASSSARVKVEARKAAGSLVQFELVGGV